MDAIASRWILKPQEAPPDWLLELLQGRSPNPAHRFAAQLLWQRGLTDAPSTLAFLDPRHYTPAPPWDLGPELDRAVARLQQARDRQETIFIWGDFDADGITATAVLWEGLGQFFVPHQTLKFTIPNRLTESHGLSKQGLAAIAAQGCQLVLTCDTGSSNLDEIIYAQTLGLDVIVTDHHTLPPDRPPVAAFVNPRTLPQEHPLAHLSGVAVAYKLIEALYQTWPEIPQTPLENLLDLVAIGLIADLVQLTGDCRYLAQRGLLRLKQQLNTPTRPGIAHILTLCRRNGDRPADISFGLGPRINAISRIQGDAQEGVELLTTHDPERAILLAEGAEWTNLCRKEVQQRVVHEAQQQLARLDITNTPVLVLGDPQWPVGVLGLVASQLAQTYSRPTLLMQTTQPLAPGTDQPLSDPSLIARGSARSVAGIDLYELLQQQSHLLTKLGGHPFAAGFSLPMENVPLLTASLHQAARQHWGEWQLPLLNIDLVLTLADMVSDPSSAPQQTPGSKLFEALSQLEPYGMGNPIPRILIRNCWLENRRSTQSQKAQSQKFGNQSLRFKKAQFHIRDDSTPTVFPGVWWDHDADELPQGRCDVVIELDYGRISKQSDGFHGRLVAVRDTESFAVEPPQSTQPTPTTEPWLLDWRSQPLPSPTPPNTLRLDHCPNEWTELDQLAQQAQTQHQNLALSYHNTEDTTLNTWQHLVGIAKYAARTEQPLSIQEVQHRLGLTPRSLTLGIEALQTLGFKIDCKENHLYLSTQPEPIGSTQVDTTQVDQTITAKSIQQFIAAISEDQFQQRYFQRIPVAQLQQILEQRLYE